MHSRKLRHHEKYFIPLDFDLTQSVVRHQGPVFFQVWQSLGSVPGEFAVGVVSVLSVPVSRCQSSCGSHTHTYRNPTGSSYPEREPIYELAVYSLLFFFLNRTL